MSEPLITVHVRKILDTLARNHRTAHQELREGMAALAAAAAKGKLQKDGTRIHEQ